MNTQHAPHANSNVSIKERRAGRRVYRLAILTLAMLGAVSGPAFAAAPNTRVSAADRTFLQTASQGNRFEIASGEVAVQVTKKTQTTPAKQLAIMAGTIVVAHQKSQKRLAALANSLNVNISDQPDPVQQFLVTQIAGYAAKLNTGQTSTSGQTSTDPNKTNNGNIGSAGGKKGSNGNATPTPGTSTTSSTGTTVGALRGFFLDVQAAVHQQAIQSYSTIALGTQNKGVRTYACQTLPVLRRHLATVQRALGSVQPELATSGYKALTAKVDSVCKSVATSH
ncbi:MAG TPA: DUF4142 domain-containing protein [Microbacteriaceae bacterium]|jgi:predicted outer membrane protein|nr:DUF4142 domain-containing protein [Microbacteriaceae bacterium]